MSEEETRTTRHGPGSSLSDIPLAFIFSPNAIESLRVTAKSRILEPRLEKGNEHFELWSLFFLRLLLHLWKRRKSSK